MGLNYLSIPKLQRLHRWSLGLDKYFHPALYDGCNYLSILELQLNHVRKRGRWWRKLPIGTPFWPSNSRWPPSATLNLNADLSAQSPLYTSVTVSLASLIQIFAKCCRVNRPQMVISETIIFRIWAMRSSQILWLLNLVYGSTASKLRIAGPLWEESPGGQWLLTRYQLCVNLFRVMTSYSRNLKKHLFLSCSV